MSRDLSPDFLNAMRAKLDHGRAIGYVGWDQHWNDCTFPSNPGGPMGLFMQRLQQETIELALAIQEGNPERIMLEAADVANFAMFVADLYQPVEEGDET